MYFDIDFCITRAYLSMPSKRGCLYLRDRSNPPPHAASMCSHNLYFSQMSAMALIGSKAPSTVVPAVAETKNGMWPFDFRSNMSRSSSDGIMRPLSCETKIVRENKMYRISKQLFARLSTQHDVNNWNRVWGHVQKTQRAHVNENISI